MKNNGQRFPQRFSPATPPLAFSVTDLGLLTMALIWGINFSVIKASLGEIPGLAFNALRFPMAAATVYAILRMKGGVRWPEPRDRPRILALGILGNVVYQGFFIFGVDATFAGNAAILLATTPVWILGLSTLRGHERPGPQVWIGILATVSGMVMVVVGGGMAVGFQGDTFRGDLLMVGAAITWSTYSVGARGMVRKYGAIPVTAWTLWIGSAGLVILGVPSLLRLQPGAVAPFAWAGVAYAGVLAIGLAYIFWYGGVQKLGNSRTAAYNNLTPIVALAAAWLGLGEVPATLQILGAVAVLTGLTMARRGRDRDA